MGQLWAERCDVICRGQKPAGYMFQRPGSEQPRGSQTQGPVRALHVLVSSETVKSWALWGEVLGWGWIDALLNNKVSVCHFELIPVGDTISLTYGGAKEGLPGREG